MYANAKESFLEEFDNSRQGLKGIFVNNLFEMVERIAS
jgi:hypothetical protein